MVANVVPDIVLLDVRMPKRTGLEACIEIKQLVRPRGSSC
jgi:CheY-like chemotaxis protein